MAGPRSFMIMDRGDRNAHLALQLQQQHQSLHSQFLRPGPGPRGDIQDEDNGRLGVGLQGRMMGEDAWELHHLQALAPAGVCRQRVNAASSPHHLTSLDRAQRSGQQQADWEAGACTRHVAVSSARLERSIILNETARFRKTVGLSRDVLAGCRTREEREEIGDAEFYNGNCRGWDPSFVTAVDEDRSREDMSRVYNRSPVAQSVGSRNHISPGFVWDEPTHHPDLASRYNIRPAPRYLDGSSMHSHLALMTGSMPCKRSRDEEMEPERERGPRQRRFPENLSPSGSVQVHPLFRTKECHDLGTAQFSTGRGEEEDHEDGQVTPPPLAIMPRQRNIDSISSLFHQDPEGKNCRLVARKLSTSPFTEDYVESAGNVSFKDRLEFRTTSVSPPNTRAKSCSSRPLTATSPVNSAVAGAEDLERLVAARDQATLSTMRDQKEWLRISSLALSRPVEAEIRRARFGRSADVATGIQFHKGNFARRSSKQLETNNRNTKSRTDDRDYLILHQKRQHCDDDGTQRISRPSMLSSRKSRIGELHSQVKPSKLPAGKLPADRLESDSKRKAGRTNAKDTRHGRVVAWLEEHRKRSNQDSIEKNSEARLQPTCKAKLSSSQLSKIEPTRLLQIEKPLSKDFCLKPMKTETGEHTETTKKEESILPRTSTRELETCVVHSKGLPQFDFHHTDSNPIPADNGAVTSKDHASPWKEKEAVTKVLVNCEEGALGSLPRQLSGEFLDGGLPTSGLSANKELIAGGIKLIPQTQICSKLSALVPKASSQSGKFQERMPSEGRGPEKRLGNLSKPDLLQLRLEGCSMLPSELDGSIQPSASQITVPLVNEHLEVYEQRVVTPKLIYTGHKVELKDVSSQRSDQALKDSPSTNGVMSDPDPEVKVANCQEVLSTCIQEWAVGDFGSKSLATQHSTIFSTLDQQKCASPRSKDLASSFLLTNSQKSIGTTEFDDTEMEFSNKIDFDDNDSKLSLALGPEFPARVLCLSNSELPLLSLTESQMDVHSPSSLQSSHHSEASRPEKTMPAVHIMSHLELSDDDRQLEAGTILLSDTPSREVRLFGTNLNASLSEAQDMISKTDKSNEWIANPLSDSQHQSSSSFDECLNTTSTRDDKGESVCNAIPIEEPTKLSELLLAEHKLHQPPLTCKELVLQAQASQLQEPEPMLPDQQDLPMLLLGKAATAFPNRTRSTAVNTWHRGASGNPAHPVSLAKVPIMIGGSKNSGGSGRGAQLTSYVRKGNSLVRAPGNSSSQHKAMNSKSGAIRTFPIPAKQANRAPQNSKRAMFTNTNSVPPSEKSLTQLGFGHNKPLAASSELSGSLVNTLSLPPSAPSCTDIMIPTALSLSQSKTPQIVPCSARGVSMTSEQLMAASSHVLDSVIGTSSNSLAQKIGGGGTTANCTASEPVTSHVSSRLYVRRKANQLVVATPSQSKDTILTAIQNKQQVLGGSMPDEYIKRKTNQLVRNGAVRGVANKFLGQGRPRSGFVRGITEDQRDSRSTSSVSRKTALGRVLSQKNLSAVRLSWVWTLNGANGVPASVSSTKAQRAGPFLLPWKRPSVKYISSSRRHKSLPEGKKGSLLFLISKRLRKVRKVQPVYTRSAHGFALHRSGVLSLGGANLKWTKSLEKRAKQASEAATKAVAAAERKKREKMEAVVEAASVAAKKKSDRRAARKVAQGGGERVVWVGLVRYKMDAARKTLQRLPDLQGASDGVDFTTSTKVADCPALLTPRRPIIGGTAYLRVGNGNQLVRDPKAAIRALASEKVRWSLHNARFRRAKKQQYCQFFTRFGKCNKDCGKCHYIHDSEKVAVCTKFLKGTCTDSHCLLTHKVIPERMPDCSYFLQGLCTHENCPYRHVNVNPKASNCQEFLRGYCANGDKCNKKHTYVCPTYAETGECSDRASCKLHHPQKKDKQVAPLNENKNVRKRKRRYFSSSELPTRQNLCDSNSRVGEISLTDKKASGEDPLCFISLSTTNTVEDEELTKSIHLWPRSRFSLMILEQASMEERERLIKPTFLLHSL